MSVYLGIDLGTTGLKALLIREDGTICGTGYRQYSISIPVTGYAQQHPEDWWAALKESLADALDNSGVKPSDIAGIGLSGQMHGMVLTDKNDRLLYPAIIWCDQRSSEQVAMVQEIIGREKLGEWTQNPVCVGFQLCSLLWIRCHRPDIYEKICHVLLPKDYIRFLLTGEYGTEPTDACSTLMFDCARQDWSAPLLEALNIDRRLLPDANHLPTDVHGTLTASAAADLELRPGIPVVFGGGDQPMQAIGNGILMPGCVSITLGTGGQIFAPVGNPVYDPKLRTHTFCHATPNTWYVMGAILNCCLAQNWFFDKVLGVHGYGDMHDLAAKSAPGSDGLFFLPYLTGERTPYMDPQARGIFFGLTLGHDRASMTRAVIEGISYALSDAMECMEKLIPHTDRLVLSGGGARSALWKQIIADMLDQPIYTSSMTEEASVGAAVCAMVGTGAYASLSEACKVIVHYEDGFVAPIHSHREFYHEQREVYRELYRVNHTLFSQCGKARVKTERSLNASSNY